MLIVDCPWCEGPATLDSVDIVACDACSVRVELAPEPSAEVALAA